LGTTKRCNRKLRAASADRSEKSSNVEKKKQQIINEEYASWTRMAHQMREELKAELTHVA
jgi:hypothetical protein